MTDTEAKVLADVVRQTSLQLHTFLKWGHLEKVYENGLVNRLSKKGIQVEQQHPISVKDEDGTIIGDYIADLLVAGEMILEIKASDSLSDAHVAQILGYLRATGLRHGMLINFGSQALQIKKLVL
jgi:GxxExxY protein